MLGHEYFLRCGELKGVLGILKAILQGLKLATHGLDPLEAGQANTHTVMTKENKLYALHEGSLPFELQLSEDGSIAKGIGYESFGGVLDYAVSAHPKVDHVTGNFLFHSYSIDPMGVSPSFKFGEWSSKTGKVESYFGVKTEDGHSSFGHEMMFTENWFIIIDNSVHFDPSQILNEGDNVFKWNDQANLRIGLAPRHKANTTSDDVIWFSFARPHVLIHALNSWEEEDGTVVMWAPLGDFFDINMDQGGNVYHMTELRMDPTTGQCETHVIDEEYNVEFPRIREDFTGRFGRYGTSGIMDPSLGGDGLFKGFAVYDMLEKRTKQVIFYQEGEVGGEPVVLPKPGRPESHAFYVATFVHDKIRDKSFFLLFDGEDGEQVARIELPHRVPYGFHGEWVDEQQLQDHINHHSTNI